MIDEDREVLGYGPIEPDEEDSDDDDDKIFEPERNFADVFSNST